MSHQSLSSWLRCCDKLCESPDLSDCETMAGMAAELEAEVERLRVENACMRGKLRTLRQEITSYDDEVVSGVARSDLLGTIDDLADIDDPQVDAYRAAVAEVRDLLAKGRLDGRDLSRMDAILDKLPKDAP